MCQLKINDGKRCGPTATYRSIKLLRSEVANAPDAGASPAGRQAVHKRVIKELQGLIEFPKEA